MRSLRWGGDNALAETVNGLYKTKFDPATRTVAIHDRAGRARDLEYVWWWNNQRLHGELGMRTPLEVEAAYYVAQESSQPASSWPGRSRDAARTSRVRLGQLLLADSNQRDPADDDRRLLTHLRPCRLELG